MNEYTRLDAVPTFTEAENYSGPPPYPSGFSDPPIEVPMPAYIALYDVHGHTVANDYIQNLNSHLSSSGMPSFMSPAPYHGTPFDYYGAYPSAVISDPFCDDYANNSNTVYQSVLTMPPNVTVVALPTSATLAGHHTALSAYHPPDYLIQNSSPMLGIDARYQKNHACEECGKLFDRHTRARDHAYKDRGESPHCCGGECGKIDCDATYWSEERLLGHIKPEKAQCHECLHWITKKNIARHRVKSCSDRLRVGPSGIRGSNPNKV